MDASFFVSRRFYVLSIFDSTLKGNKHQVDRRITHNKFSTEAEVREAAHQGLSWNAHHDSFLLLMDCGDQSAMPVLIHSMRRIPAHQLESEMVGCTWNYCRDALKTITKRDFGYGADRCAAWCETSQSVQDYPPVR